MSGRGRHAMWLRPVAVVGCIVGLIAGCGGGTQPGEAVPALEKRLSAVDSAIADHEYRQARRQIQRLVTITVAAREAGELAPEEADPILAAAASLTSALPRMQRTQPLPPEPEPAPDVDEGGQGEPPAPEPDPDAGLSEEEQGKHQEELEKKREELQKKREEEQKKEEEEGGGEEGGGNGDSSENGPDDGHGN